VPTERRLFEEEKIRMSAGKALRELSFAPECKGNSPVVVGWDGVRHPCRLGIGVDDADGGDVFERALVQEDIVLNRVQTHDQVGLDRLSLNVLVVERADGLIVLVDEVDLQALEEHVAVGDCARRPFCEEVVPFAHLCGLDDHARLARPVPDKENVAARKSHAIDDARCPAQVRGCLLQRDDVNALANAENIPCVGWVPERGVVAHVHLRSHKELEGDVGRARRVAEDVVRVIDTLSHGTSLGDVALEVLCPAELGGCVVGDVGLFVAAPWFRRPNKE